MAKLSSGKGPGKFGAGSKSTGGAAKTLKVGSGSKKAPSIVGKPKAK